MGLSADIAYSHLRRRQTVSDAATVRALRLWRGIDPQLLDVGWAQVGGQITQTVAAGQVTVARQSAPYLSAVDSVHSVTSNVRLVPEAFAGVTADGRELESALFGAVAETKRLTGAGYSAFRAFEVGASFLATIAGAAIQDMGRIADSTLGVGHKYLRYVRVLSPGACSRCAVLAGKGDYSKPFLRHPRCKCQSFPIPLSGPSGVPDGLFDSGSDYFHSLSRGEQDRIFTNAGAEAIRQGGDLNRVVNARRGAYGIGYSNNYSVSAVRSRLQPVTIGRRADGSPLQVFATTESTTRRGQFGRQNFTGTGRRTQTSRLMPETISKMAGGDSDRWIELLYRYGYLDKSGALYKRFG